MDTGTIGIVGAGALGTDLAELAALSGFTVVLIDTDGAALERAVSTIDQRLGALVASGQLDAQDRTEVVEAIDRYDQLTELAIADVVLEAAPEDEELKKRIFAELATFCRPEAILATCSASIAVASIASATDRPQDVVGLRFAEPVRSAERVEVIRGPQTDDSTTALALEVIDAMGRSGTVIAPGGP